MGRGRSLMIGLALLAGFQGVWLVVRGERGGSLSPLTYGASFEPELTRLDGSGQIELIDTCWVAFVLDPDCGACRRLAERIGSETRVAERGMLLWVSAADVDETRAFADSFRIPYTQVGVVERPASLLTRDVLVALGVPATPTRLILAPDGVIADQLLTWQLPNEEELSALCD